MAVVTTLKGEIIYANEHADIYFTGEHYLEGQSIINFISLRDQNNICHILKVPQTPQPHIAYNTYLSGLSEPLAARIYKHTELGFCLFMFESVQISEEVLVAQEEQKWAERLQIMLFGISHELKTPLAVARGYTEVLAGGASPQVANKVMDALERISGILNDMSEPVRALNTDQNRIDLGRSLELYCKTIPYIDPMKTYAGTFTADIQYGTGKTVRLSKPRFYQVITNLFENAIRATDHLDTSAHINVSTRSCEKKHHVSCLVLEFEDNGVGMSEETQQRIFTPYFTTREKDTGSGLGGYFIYQFVMDAGGSIDLDSELGEGTTYAIHLPYE